MTIYCEKLSWPFGGPNLPSPRMINNPPKIAWKMHKMFKGHFLFWGGGSLEWKMTLRVGEGVQKSHFWKLPLHTWHTLVYTYMHDDDPCNEIATQHARVLKYIIHCCCLRALRHGAVPPSHAYVLVVRWMDGCKKLSFDLVLISGFVAVTVSVLMPWLLRAANYIHPHQIFR